MGKKCAAIVCLIFGLCSGLRAQTLPDDQVQIDFSGYFDSFNVSVLYPTVAITHRVSPTTSLTGRYLVDMVSAASMRASTPTPVVTTPSTPAPVDVVTSASGRVIRVVRGAGGTYIQQPSRPTFSDVRHEVGLGITQLVAGRTLAVNGLYSREHDYSSATMAGTFTQWFAEKNTTLELGMVHSWDRVFPVTKDWTRDKSVTSFSANFSQILSQRLIFQILTSYIENSGYMADAYEMISIPQGDSTASFDPIRPNRRVQRAAAVRLKYRLNNKSSLQLGYRYYWDSWSVRSHTFSEDYERYVSPHVILGLGFRSYLQSRAFFFQPQYSQPEKYMTADVKLDSGFSNQLQLDLTLYGGGDHDVLTFLDDDRLQCTFSLDLYQRHTTSPYWFNHSKNLIATNFTTGIQYRF